MFVAGWEAVDVGIEGSVTELGSMFEFEGVSLEVKVGIPILEKFLKLTWMLSTVCSCTEVLWIYVQTTWR